ILAIAAAITNGWPLPEQVEGIDAANVIYQTAEDGLGDTIKPRLLAMEADLDRVHVIDESSKDLTLSDARIEQAITATGAKLFILDPLQAYLGAGVDMHRANEVRPVFKQLGQVAERSGCAIVIVGHLNKSMNKGQYRGLGSIDIFAAARSVLTLGRVRGKPTYRAFVQGKSNLAPEGKAIAFELDPERGFRWVGACNVTLDDLLNGTSGERETTYDRAVALLKAELTVAMPAKDIIQMTQEQNISPRTLYKAKADLGVRSIKQEGQWFWSLPQDVGKEQGCNAACGQEVQSSSCKDAEANPAQVRLQLPSGDNVATLYEEGCR
ncbi:AAA family ATPase, partial [Bacteroides sp. OttesenSCG-928-J23]|nr:AAA family ATPase [Bacteroides sp. OttesenSCG-928-J23]